jgi:hypothetical protein
MISFTVDTPFKSLKEYTNSWGEKYRKLSYEVEMVPSGASLDFVVYVNGKRQGAQNVAVSFK